MCWFHSTLTMNDIISLLQRISKSYLRSLSPNSMCFSVTEIESINHLLRSLFGSADEISTFVSFYYVFLSSPVKDLYESCILLFVRFVICFLLLDFRHDNKSSVWQLTTPPNDYMHNQIVIIIHIYRLANTRTLLSVRSLRKMCKN